MGEMKRIVLGLTGVTILLAAGCSGDSGTSPGTTVTVTPTASMSSASSSPTFAPPVLPAVAKQSTQAGAKAFFRYFWDVYNYSYDARDVAALRGISDEKCTFCQSTVEDVEKTLRKDLHFQGGLVAVNEAAVAPDDPMAGVLVQGLISQGSSVLLDAKGQQVSTASAESKIRVDAALIFRNSRWVVLEIDKDPPS